MTWPLLVMLAIVAWLMAGEVARLRREAEAWAEFWDIVENVAPCPDCGIRGRGTVKRHSYCSLWTCECGCSKYIEWDHNL